MRKVTLKKVKEFHFKFIKNEATLSLSSIS